MLTETSGRISVLCSYSDGRITCTKVRYAQALIIRYAYNDTNIMNQFFKDWSIVGRVLKIPQLSYPGVVTLFCVRPETWRCYD
jgi:hypothetical protein